MDDMMRSAKRARYVLDEEILKTPRNSQAGFQQICDEIEYDKDVKTGTKAVNVKKSLEAAQAVEAMELAGVIKKLAIKSSSV
jgi:hypothetical protein